MSRSGVDFKDKLRIYGFCCEHLFFTLNIKVRTGVLALLLECDRTTVAKHRRSFKAGILLRCASCPSDRDTLSLFAREADDTSSPLRGPFRRLPVFRGKT